MRTQKAEESSWYLKLIEENQIYIFNQKTNAEQRVSKLSKIFGLRKNYFRKTVNIGQVCWRSHCFISLCANALNLKITVFSSQKWQNLLIQIRDCKNYYSLFQREEMIAPLNKATWNMATRARWQMAQSHFSDWQASSENFAFLKKFDGRFDKNVRLRLLISY